MKRRRWIACIGALALAAAGCQSASKKGSAPPPNPAPSSPEDMAKMIEMYMKLATPGSHHDHLKPLAGEWSVAGKFRMTPDADWEEHKSTGKAEWVLGGRFLRQHYVGEPMMGMPMGFEGIGHLGFDNHKEKYVTTWMDNMGTMIMTSEGTCEAGGKTIKTRSDFIDPMTGAPSYMNSVLTIESPDRYVHRMYVPAPDGKEFLMMELVHTRKR
jgi:hypothetical protein